MHKRTASTGQGSGRSLFCRRNPYLIHVHIYTTAQARARTQYSKLDYLASPGCKQQQDSLGIMGFTYLSFWSSLRWKAFILKHFPLGKHQSLLKNYPEMPPQPTPQAEESRYLPCASHPNSSLWEVSQDPHCFD